MADETFQVGMAIGIQSGTTVNATIAALDGTTALASSNGIVLGDKGSGDAESGITIPDIEQIVREVATVTGSFTQQADAFLRAAITGFDVTIPMQGNGATATPAVGEAQPLAGPDVLWQIAGLTGANGGANAEYDYSPTTGTGTLYATVKLWVGDHSFVFKDCVCDTTTLEFTPGGSALATFAMRVGSLNAFATGIGTLGTWDYTTQASLANPPVEGVAFTWGTGHPSSGSGFESLSVTISQPISTFGDSNVATTGTREIQTGRVFTVDGRLFSSDADSDYDYQNLISTSAPTDDLSFQVGTAQTGAGTINAFLVECNNLQAKAIKYDRTGSLVVAEISGAKCTATSDGGEFRLTFN